MRPRANITKRDHLTFVLLGNAAKIREAAGKYAPRVVEVSVTQPVMDMEADRIRDLSFEAKGIESERGVVYSEWQLSVGSNSGALYEQLFAAAFVAHPYHWPVIGWPSDIESWSMDDLKAHFRMGYAPNNCVVVVVGDVSNAEVMALAKKYLEPIPRRDPPPPVRTKEPEQGKGE